MKQEADGPKQSKVIKQEVIKEAKWLGMKSLDYSIGDKIVHNYEAVYRTTTKTKGFKIDGVEVIPILKYQEQPSELILIANFRPPVNSFTLEFPSGLLEDEDYEENARRELLEETGYRAKQFIKIHQPVMYCDPWKSNESGLLYIGLIDGDDPASLPQKQSLDDDENIRVHKVILDHNLADTLNALISQKGYVIESKVWTLCLGLMMNQFMK